MMPLPRPRKRRDKAPSAKPGTAKTPAEAPDPPATGSGSRRRPTRAQTSTATPTHSGGLTSPSTLTMSRGDATNSAPPALLKRSRSTNPTVARAAPRKPHNKRETDCAVGLVLERITPEESDAPATAGGRRHPRSAKAGPSPPASSESAHAPERPGRAVEKSRMRKEAGAQGKRGGTAGGGNASACGGGQGGGMRSEGGGSANASSVGCAGGNGGLGSAGGAGGNGASGGRRSAAKKTEAAVKAMLQGMSEKPKSPRSPSPRAASPQRNSSPSKRTNKHKNWRRGSKSSSRSRMRGKRVNYTYQLLNELSLSPRRGTGKGRGTRGSSLQRPPWRASFIKSVSRASVSKVSRRGSRSSLASSARRRCRSSRPVRYRLKASERRFGDSRTRSPFRAGSRSPSTPSVGLRGRKNKERGAAGSRKQGHRSATRKAKCRMGRDRSRKARSRGSIGSSVSSLYSRIGKGKRAAAKARAKVSRRSCQGRRRKPRDPTFALENILEFLEPPKGDNKSINKQPPPVVVRPSPPPTPRLSTGRLTPSADFMHPDTAAVIHDVLQELQGPKSNPSAQLCSVTCVSAADIREKLASTSTVLVEEELATKSRSSITDVTKTKSVSPMGVRGVKEGVSQDEENCQQPVSSNLLLDTLRQMCNTPSRFVMHHRRRVPRSEREWAMGAAQKVGNTGLWSPSSQTAQGPSLAERITMSRSLIPQAWLGPKFPSKSHFKSTRTTSVKTTNFSNSCATAAAIAAATVAASAPPTPGAAYGGGPVTVSALKCNNGCGKDATLTKYTAPLAPPASCGLRPTQSMIRSLSTPAPLPAPNQQKPNTPSTPKTPTSKSCSVRPLMRALSAHTCSPLRHIPSNSEVRRSSTDIGSSRNMSPSSSSSSCRFRRRRRRRLTGARSTPRDPVSAVQLFAQPPHPLWPPMAAVRRKGTSKHQLSQSSLDNSTATSTTANTVVTNPNSLSTDLTEEVRPLRSCLKPGTCRPCSPTHQVKAISSKCQFGGVGEGNVVSPESPLMRFSK